MQSRRERQMREIKLLRQMIDLMLCMETVNYMLVYPHYIPILQSASRIQVACLSPIFIPNFSSCSKQTLISILIHSILISKQKQVLYKSKERIFEEMQSISSCKSLTQIKTRAGIGGAQEAGRGQGQVGQESGVLRGWGEGQGQVGPYLSKTTFKYS